MDCQGKIVISFCNFKRKICQLNYAFENLILVRHIFFHLQIVEVISSFAKRKKYE
jgi:hypothetical protein